MSPTVTRKLHRSVFVRFRAPLHTLVISIAIGGRIVKVDMIVFEQFGHEKTTRVSESAKESFRSLK
jgi:hypothetical protein